MLMKLCHPIVSISLYRHRVIMGSTESRPTGVCWWLAAAASMSVGVHAREMSIVNGHLAEGRVSE